MSLLTFIHASAHDMPQVTDGSVQMIATSPPYYGLRKYAGAQDVDWPAVDYAPMPGLPTMTVDAMRCPLGNENTLEAYIAHMVLCLREWRRVLRDDGIAFVNLADSYNSAASNMQNGTVQRDGYNAGFDAIGRKSGIVKSLKPKDLMMVPARFALAAQADGWWLRSDMIGAKVAPMPECLDPQTKVFVRSDGTVSHVALDELLDMDSLPEILTPSGWRRIIKVWETWKETAIRFEAAKVQSVLCSPEHLWPVSHDRRRTVVHEITTAELRDEGYKDYLLHYTIGDWIDGSIAEISGQAADYDLGWLLGLYAAEGGFGEARGHRCKFTLHAKERAIIDRLSVIAAERFGVTISERSAGNYTSVRFSSGAWHDIAKTVVPGDCKTKSLNSLYVLNTSESFRRGLWDGYIEGDGSDRERGVSATSASESLRDSMAILASTLRIITSKGQVRQHDVRTGKTYISYQLWTPYVEHRKEKKGSVAKQLTVRNKVEVVGPHRMIDLEVDGGLFLIGDGLCTHNSVTDRPTRSHEHIFMLTKRATYFCDMEGVKERASVDKQISRNSPLTVNCQMPGRDDGHTGLNDYADSGTRNMRDVIEWRPQGFSAAHFATWPEAIPERLIRIGSSERGCCPHCGAAWRRVVEREANPGGIMGVGNGRHAYNDPSSRTRDLERERNIGKSQTIAFAPSCTCAAHEPTPCVVLDPFSGSGTTAKVAARLGRRGIGVDISQEYLTDITAARMGDGFQMEMIR